MCLLVYLTLIRISPFDVDVPLWWKENTKILVHEFSIKFSDKSGVWQ